MTATEKCNHSLQNYHDKIAKFHCVTCYLEQSEAALKRATIQMIGMAAWLKSSGQPKVAESADEVIEQMQSALNMCWKSTTQSKEAQ